MNAVRGRRTSRAARTRARAVPHVAFLSASFAAITVATSSCGPAVDSATTATDGSSPSVVASTGVPERITPAGVAAVVSDHLGREAVRRFVVYDPEAGSVGVLVDLRDGERADNFVVSVWSPDRRLGELQDTSCRSDGEGPLADGSRTCRRLDDGTTVEVRESEAFSDDNASGFTVRGTALSPDGGASLAMYESYDDSAPLSLDTLSAMLSDPRLRWLTDPSVNEAGASIELTHLDG
jgi:hypothetical protein